MATLWLDTAHTQIQIDRHYLHWFIYLPASTWKKLRAEPRLPAHELLLASGSRTWVTPGSKSEQEKWRVASSSNGKLSEETACPLWTVHYTPKKTEASTLRCSPSHEYHFFFQPFNHRGSIQISNDWTFHSTEPTLFWTCYLFYTFLSTHLDNA